MSYQVDQFDLQLFAEERTEKATPHRREEARKRGQVARSIEINSAVILLCTFLAIKGLSPWLGTQVANFGKCIFGDFLLQDFDQKTLLHLLTFTAVAFFQVCLPVMAVALGAGLVANYFQVGFLLTGYPLTPRLERINPISGWKRIFSRRALLELGKAVAKVGITGYLVYSTIKANLFIFPRLVNMSLADAVGQIGDLSSKIILRIGIFLLLLAVIDYIYQYWEYDKNLRMTKQELKEEHRQYEGDPLIKGRIRQRQRQVSYHRMMQQVPRADVVITNPTHYAVALRYEPQEMDAPVVLAKGMDALALRIREIAHQYGIAIYEDPPLARVLYKSVDIGQAIPSELYEAVAGVLAFVYRLRQHKLPRLGVN